MPFVLMLLTSLLLLGQANAYPEMVRHGYVNCTSCHVAPSGGGILTPYGRSLSKEVLSTWGRANEEGVLHGLLKEDILEGPVNVGGDVRALQAHRETETVKEGRFIWMQADLEAAVTVGKVTVDGTIGRIEKRSGPSIESRRYFAMYQARDELTIRAGRFTPVFGLLIPDHVSPTRRDLGFDQGRETHNLEVAWNGEVWNFFATAATSPGEIAPTSREDAIATQVNYSFWERFKVGASHWIGRSDRVRRQIAGAHAILGFTHRLYLLSEFDLQWREQVASGSSQRGLFSYQKLGYEFIQGFHALGILEYSQADLGNGGSARDGIGAGLQWFPRPHFEFQGVWEKVRTRSEGSHFDDSAWLLAHYYF